jgi:hypothetical protein
MSECAVCLEELERAVWCTMPCAHRICFRCLLRMWEHSRRSCPLCRHSISDCLPAPRIRVRRVEEITSDTTSDEAFERIVRRMQVSSVIENALRATPPIAPRNALTRSRSLRIVVPASPSQE